MLSSNKKQTNHNANLGIQYAKELCEIPRDLMDAYLHLNAFIRHQFPFMEDQLSEKYIEMMKNYYVDEKEKYSFIQNILKFIENPTQDDLKEKISKDIKRAADSLKKHLQLVSFLEGRAKKEIENLNRKINKYKKSHENFSRQIKTAKEAISALLEIKNSIQSNIFILERTSKDFSGLGQQSMMKEIVSNSYQIHKELNKFTQTNHNIISTTTEMAREITRLTISINKKLENDEIGLDEHKALLTQFKRQLWEFVEKYKVNKAIYEKQIGEYSINAEKYQQINRNNSRLHHNNNNSNTSSDMFIERYHEELEHYYANYFYENNNDSSFDNMLKEKDNFDIGIKKINDLIEWAADELEELSEVSLGSSSHQMFAQKNNTTTAAAQGYCAEPNIP